MVANTRHPTPPPLKDIARSSAQFRYSSYNINDVDSKRILVQRVPLLQQVLSGIHCQEDELLDSLVPVIFSEGDHIFKQGVRSKALYFVESGQVVITQRRAKQITSFASLVANLSGTHDDKFEVHTWTFRTHDTFGDMSFLFDGEITFDAVATAPDTTTCYKIDNHRALEWFTPLFPLMWFRYHIRLSSVLETCTLFKKFSALQLQYILDHCKIQTYEDGEYICRKGEMDDRFFIVVQGSAKIYSFPVSPDTTEAETDDGISFLQSNDLDKSRANGTGDSNLPPVAAVKNVFQCFGEMGLLGRERTAHVIASNTNGNNGKDAVLLPKHILAKCSDVARYNGVVCVVIPREQYNIVLQMKHIKADKSMLDTLAYSLEEEWRISDSIRLLQLENPKIVRHLVSFVTHIRDACNARLAGQNVYLDAYKRFNDVGSDISGDFDSVAGKLSWSSLLPSLCILRAEVRRILLLAPAVRSSSDITLVARIIDCTTLFNLFETPKYMDTHKVSLQLAKHIGFLHVPQDTVIFKQGNVDHLAFVILRGSVNIVIEEAVFPSSNGLTPSAPAVKQEVIAVLPSGCIFGELALVASLPRSATAIAASDCDFLVIDKAHIAAICRNMPEIAVRHAVAKRAETLSKLSFMRNCSFAQCYRMAHDTREQVHDLRTVFPCVSTSLYIVQEGEVAVLLRRAIVPSMEKRSVETVSPLKLTPRSSSRTLSARVLDLRGRVGLVHVATMGKSEIFATESVALLNAATLVSPEMNDKHNDVTYMCQSSVKVLEIPEKCWRRLPSHVLASIMNVFAERHRWNEACVSKQQYPVFFAPDKPWLLIHRSTICAPPSSPMSSPTKMHSKSCKCKQCMGNITGTNGSSTATSKLHIALHEKRLEITNYARKIIRGTRSKRSKQGRVCLTTISGKTERFENGRFSMGRSTTIKDLSLSGSFAASTGPSLNIVLSSTTVS